MKQRGLAEHLRKRMGAYLFSSILFITGTLAGAVAIRTLNLRQKQDLIGYINLYFDNMLLGTIEPISWQSALIANATTLGFVLLCGVIVFGVPGILIFLVLRGFVIGFTVAFFVDEMGIKGLIFSFAAVFPHNIAFVPALIGIGALGFSFAFSVVAGKGNRHVLRRRGLSIKDYVVDALPFILLGVTASLIEAFITPIFVKAAIALF